MTQEGWTGLVSTVLERVKDLVSDNKNSLGLGEVRTGERRKGWENPACFIYAPRAPESSAASGRSNVEDREIHLRIVVFKKTTTSSDDLGVWKLLEAIMELLDANPGIAGTRRHDFGEPEVAPDEFGDGEYMTVGILPVTYRKALCRSTR